MIDIVGKSETLESETLIRSYKDLHLWQVEYDYIRILTSVGVLEFPTKTLFNVTQDYSDDEKDWREYRISRDEDAIECWKFALQLRRDMTKYINTQIKKVREYHDDFEKACFKCEYSEKLDKITLEKKIECKRYPTPEIKNYIDYCGEFKLNLNKKENYRL